MINQKEKIYASFVLYYDENTNLTSQQFNQLETWVVSYFDYYEIIIINNSSSNQNTFKQALNPSLKDTMVIDLGGKHLLDHALRAGIEFSKGDSVFIIADTYVSDLTTQLQSMYEKHKKGNDIVTLSSSYSKLRHKLLLQLISKITHEPILLRHDLVYLISKRVVNYYTQTKTHILPLTVLLQDSGYALYQVKYKTNKKVLLSKDEYTLYMMMFSDALTRVSFTLSMLCFTASILSVLYALGVHLFKKDIVEGWTTTFLLCSFGFSGIFMILSLIIRYLGLFGKEILDKPMYKTRQITKL